jgi:hypothetical protein
VASSPLQFSEPLLASPPTSNIHSTFRINSFPIHDYHVGEDANMSGS